MPYNKLIILALMLAAMSSCKSGGEKLQEEGERPKKYMTIRVTLDPETKSYLNGQDVVWEAGDQVTLSCPGWSNMDIFDINPEDVGKTTARFSGWSSSYDDYAVLYPNAITVYPQYQQSFNVDIPSTQQYRQNSFGKGANVAVGYTTDISKPINLKNAGGLLKLTVKGSATVTKIELTSKSANEYLAGTAYLAKSFGSSPTVNFVNFGTPISKLTLNCGSGVTLSPSGTDFYFFVPYGKLGGGFQVEIFDSEGESMYIQAPANEKNKIARSTITAMPAVTYSKGNIPAAFVSHTTLGIYDACLTEPVLEKAFLSSKIQGGVTSDGTNQVFSLKNWDDEWIVTFTMSAALNQDTEYDVTVNPAIGSGSGYSVQTLKLKFILAKDGLGWFVDSSTGKGYIFNVI